MMNTMNYLGHTASMTFDAEDQSIVGRVLDVDDIISFHAESVAEFEANFHTVVDDYITACERLGGVAERPASAKPMLRVAPGIHAAAMNAIARSGVGLNRWAERALGMASRNAGTTRAAHGGRLRAQASNAQGRLGLAQTSDFGSPQVRSCGQ